MTNQQAQKTLGPGISENWGRIKECLQNKWGELKDENLDKYAKNSIRLVRHIKEVTGENKDQIESFLEEVLDGSASVLAKARKTAGNLAAQAAEKLHQGYEHASDTVAHGYTEAKKMVRNKPAGSVATALGIGFLVGILMAILVKPR